MKIENKTFFSIIGFAVLAIAVAAAGAWIVRELAQRFFAQDVIIQSMARRSARPLLVDHAELQDRKVFGNVVSLLDIDGQIPAFCGDSCNDITISIDGKTGSIYPIKNRDNQYLFLCGYVTPRFSESVNKGAGQKCLDDYRGDYDVAVTFLEGRKKKIIEAGFNNFVVASK